MAVIYARHPTCRVRISMGHMTPKYIDFYFVRQSMRCDDRRIKEFFNENLLL